jgi:hypothetical protein
VDLEAWALDLAGVRFYRKPFSAQTTSLLVEYIHLYRRVGAIFIYRLLITCDAKLSRDSAS